MKKLILMVLCLAAFVAIPRMILLKIPPTETGDRVWHACDGPDPDQIVHDLVDRVYISTGYRPAFGRRACDETR